MYVDVDIENMLSGAGEVNKLEVNNNSAVSPGGAGIGEEEPTGQYTAGDPQGSCWGDVEFPVQ